MIKTYYIVGYCIINPFLTPKFRKLIDKKPESYEELSKTLKLILVGKDRILLKSLFKINKGVVYHKYSKKSNWYKLSHAAFRLKDYVKLYMTDENDAEIFLGRYVSFNTVTRKWVFASEKDVAKFNCKCYNLLKDYIEYNPEITFNIIEDVLNELKNV